eukprot:TRINITY_DN70569_c0_g1_i1.p1 TRINITY_DN70569_c0_g1~~TRINITY_DN70569_c0_g1_i1.p1  ORF type:complete len:1160 (+),score=146.35 TRINITY_DN70569_c0_g1_i1:145-3480(+)
MLSSSDGIAAKAVLGERGENGRSSFGGSRVDATCWRTYDVIFSPRRDKTRSVLIVEPFGAAATQLLERRQRLVASELRQPFGTTSALTAAVYGWKTYFPVARIFGLGADGVVDDQVSAASDDAAKGVTFIYKGSSIDRRQVDEFVASQGLSEALDVVIDVGWSSVLCLKAGLHSVWRHLAVDGIYLAQNVPASVAWQLTAEFSDKGIVAFSTPMSTSCTSASGLSPGVVGIDRATVILVKPAAHHVKPWPVSTASLLSALPAIRSADDAAVLQRVDDTYIRCWEGVSVDERDACCGLGSSKSPRFLCLDATRDYGQCCTPHVLRVSLHDLAAGTSSSFDYGRHNGGTEGDTEVEATDRRPSATFTAEMIPTPLRTTTKETTMVQAVTSSAVASAAAAVAAPEAAPSMQTAAALPTVDAAMMTTPTPATCGMLRTRFHRDGHVRARHLVSDGALSKAWDGVLDAVSFARYGGDDTRLTRGSLLHTASLPPGLEQASDMNFVHNGFLLHGIRSLWPLIMAAAVGARCLLGLSDSRSHLVGEEGLNGVQGLRLNAHVRLAPKVAGVEDHHIASHQDASYWAHRFASVEDLNDFVNATVSAWIPLVDVNETLGTLVYETGSHRRGFLGIGSRAKVPGRRERMLYNPNLGPLDDFIATASRLASEASDVGRPPLEGVLPRSHEPRAEIRPQPGLRSKPGMVAAVAEQGDVLFHNLYVGHGPLELPRTSESVRWVLEVRFLRAAAVESVATNDDDLHKLMLGPHLDGLNSPHAAFTAALDLIVRAAIVVRPRLNENTVRSVRRGSNWEGKYQLPRVGLGTGRLWPPQAVAPATEQFLRLGGRHIDTAVSYRNHGSVAAACRASSLSSREIIITTKVWPLDFDATIRATAAALAELDGAGVVVALLHSPGATSHGRPRGPGSAALPPSPCSVHGRPLSWRRCRAEAYLALVTLRSAGLIRAVGVSNFTPRHLRELREDLETLDSTGTLEAWPPEMLQTEVHPWWREEELRDVCRATGTQVIAYGSLGSPEAKLSALSDPVVQGIASTSGLTPAQVLLRWAVQSGMRVIPTTANKTHMAQILATAVDSASALNAAAMTALNHLPQWHSPIYHPYLEEIE